MTPPLPIFICMKYKCGWIIAKQREIVRWVPGAETIYGAAHNHIDDEIIALPDEIPEIWAL